MIYTHFVIAKIGDGCCGESSAACDLIPYSYCDKETEMCTCNDTFVASTDDGSCMCEPGKTLNGNGNMCETGEW